MPVDIDTLQIQVKADSEDAASGIQKLANTLERLKTATKGIGLGSASTQMKALANAAEKLAGSKSASGKIQSLANSLGAINRVPSLAAVSHQLTNLGEGMEALSSADFSSTKIQAVSGMLTGLASAPKLTGMTTVSKQLTSLAGGLTALSAAPIDESKIQSIVSAMGSLAGIGKASGLNSTLNALKKLPTISAELDTTNLTTFAAQMKEVAAAIRPLANEMQKVSNGFAAFPIRIQKIISSNAGLAASNQKAAKSFNLFGSGISGALAKMTLFGYSLKQMVSTVNGWVTSSYDYVENLNLFSVALGDGAEEALRYAESVHEALGVDVSEFIRYQGTFKGIADGFGIASDNAALMSKNLTQLSYDYASLWNMDVGKAAEKLRSAIVGETEAINSLGKSVTVATLQEVAYRNGIDKSVSAMSEAEKAQLRYLAIMEQSSHEMGDMARTIDTGANRMRIMQQQFVQLSRAMGNLFVPIIEVVLPYVQAFVEVLTEAIHGLATLAGFKIPEIELPDLDDATGGLDDELEDANKAAKELRRTLTAFDELNILNAPKEEIKLPDNDLNVELPEYEFLNEFKNNAEELKKQMKELLDIVLAVGAGLAAWGITRTIFPDLSRLKTLLGSLMIAAGITLLIDSIKEILFGDGLTWKNILEGGAGGALAGAGLGLLLAKKLGLTWASGMLLGATVGLGLSLLVMSIVSQIKDGLNIGNILLGVIGGALAGAALGGYLAWKKNPLFMAQGIIGGLVAGIGLALLISSVISILKDGLDFGNGIMGLIGGALAGFGIGVVKAGGFGGAIGLVIGAGLSLAIEGFTAQIKDGPSILGGLMTILGSALAGAGIGSVVPVIGTAGGALIGLGVGIILEIVGINAAGEAAYKATEDFKIMQTILERCADASDRTSAAFDNLKSGIDNLDSVAVDFGVASQLVDEIYAISNNASASAYELEQMAVKVDVLNSLGIDGLSLSISDTTGRVVEAREEVESLIASLEQEARMEAVRDLLVQSYKDQYQAMSDMTRAANDYDVANQALKKTADELSNTPWYNLVKRAELNAAQNKEREALESTKEVYSEALNLYRDLGTEIGNYTGYLTDLKLEERGIGDGVTNGLEGAHSTIERFKTNEFELEQWENIGENIAQGIASGITNHSYLVTDAVNNLADTSVSSAKNRLDINSPSKVFRNEVGLNIGLGIAEGLADSVRPITKEANSLANSISGAFDKMSFNIPATMSIKTPKISSVNLASPTQGVQIPHYDVTSTAGRGRAFMGPETGAALVSRMSERTAVANDSQSSLTSGVSDANKDVVNVVYAMAAQIVKAIEDKDLSVNLDGEQVARTTNPYLKKINRLQGQSLVHK